MKEIRFKITYKGNNIFQKWKLREFMREFIQWNRTLQLDASVFACFEILRTTFEINSSVLEYLVKFHI